ncbi:hypothetical protein ABK040_008014 [Willaertia magna]
MKESNINNNVNNSDNKSFKRRSGSVTTSSNKSKLYSFDTCCGTIELTGIKIASIIGMSVTVLTFTLIFAVLLAMYITQSDNQTIPFLVARGNILQIETQLTDSVVIAVYASNGTNLIDFYHVITQEYNKQLDHLLSFFPKSVAGEFNQSLQEADAQLGLTAQKMLDLARQGKRDEAIKMLFTEEYLYNKQLHTDALNNLTQAALDYENYNESVSSVLGVICIIAIIVSLALIVPVLIGTFVFAINKDAILKKKWQRANAVMLLDTMSNEKLCKLFRKFCESEHSVENFIFLEKVTYYKQVCDELIDAQMKYYGEHSDTDSASEVSGSSSSSKKSKINEQHLFELEKKKYEIALEIYTDCLDIKGDHSVNINKKLADEVKDQLDLFNTKQIPTLPINLFETTESEIAIVMLDTHHRFKQSIMFLKEMKLEKVNMLKEKKPSNNNKKEEKRDSAYTTTSTSVTTVVVAPPPQLINSQTQSQSITNSSQLTTTINKEGNHDVVVNIEYM